MSATDKKDTIILSYQLVSLNILERKLGEALKDSISFRDSVTWVYRVAINSQRKHYFPPAHLASLPSVRGFGLCVPGVWNEGVLGQGPFKMQVGLLSEQAGKLWHSLAEGSL